MAIDPRWTIRPRQRGRFGVPGLHRPNRPSAQEMAFDKIVVTVPGHFQSIADDPISPSEVFDDYRQILLSRAETSEWVWTHPVLSRASFKTELTRARRTISGSVIRARWADEVHELTLQLSLNPTRTLIHALAMFGGDQNVSDGLEALHFQNFFASTPGVGTARSLDGNDNAFDHLDELVSRLGRDHSRMFITIFEEKLKQWALDAVAPLSGGFSWIDREERLIADNGTHRVVLDWQRLFVRSAEIYCERRHGDAVGLLNRLTGVVLAAHAEADWQTYDIDEVGGRIAGSTVIGIKPTSRIEQKFYAKTRDRVRIETRYHHRVRDSLPRAAISACNPLQDILLGLREDAANRLQWDSFCTMAEEPPIPLMQDFARLVGAIARCATRARVDPEPVVAELLGAGGISETSTDGPFPRRLAHRLADEGLITRESLMRRARPGQARRHHLTQPYLSVSEMIQRTFANTGVSD